jgi:hypothetical protein
VVAVTTPEERGLPAPLRDQVESVLGAVSCARVIHLRDWPTFSALLTLAGASDRAAFLYALPPLGDREAGYRWAALVMDGAIAPAPVSHIVYGWAEILHQYVHLRTADLAPGSAEVSRLLRFLQWRQGYVRCPASVPSLSDYLTPVWARAMGALGEDGYGVLRQEDLALCAQALDGWTLSAVEGDALVHYDVESPPAAWSLGARGARWADLALLAPRLVAPGWQPSQVAHLYTLMPPSSWPSATSLETRGLAALWVLHRVSLAARADNGMERRPLLAAAGHGCAWLRHCTPPTPSTATRGEPLKRKAPAAHTSFTNA